MIDYSRGTFNLICMLRGSVFPSAFVWALPAGVLAYCAFYVFYNAAEEEQPKNSNLLLGVWTALTGSLGFLIIFRTQQAYARYWEGATLLRAARGQWFNAASCLIAFCSKSRSVRTEVEKFQHLLVRLMSLLGCASLQMIADTDSEIFCVLSLEGISTHSIEFLKSKKDRHHRVEVVMQWIQRLVIDAIGDHVVTVPAPILARFFQDLAEGNLSMNQARNLSDLPFPFPYAQLLTFLLLLFWITTPIVCGLLLQSGIAASALTFAAVFTFHGINDIASELESPFGEDMNDLPLALMQMDFNSSLWILLENQSKYLPTFDVSSASMHRSWNVEEIALDEAPEMSKAASEMGKGASMTSVSSISSMAEEGGLCSCLKRNRKKSFMARKSQTALDATANPHEIGVAPRLKHSETKQDMGTSSQSMSSYPVEPMFRHLNRDPSQSLSLGNYLDRSIGGITLSEQPEIDLEQNGPRGRDLQEAREIDIEDEHYNTIRR